MMVDKLVRAVMQWLREGDSFGELREVLNLVDVNGKINA